MVANRKPAPKAYKPCKGVNCTATINGGALKMYCGPCADEQRSLYRNQRTRMKRAEAKAKREADKCAATSTAS